MTPAHVTLPMYDAPEVRDATRALAAALATAVTSAGWPAVAADTAFATHAELEAHWAAAGGAVAVTHTCGLPLVETLAGRAESLGTFVWRGLSRPDGWYRSVIVVGAGAGAGAGDGLRGVRPAVSHPQSLSGWASLGWALGERGVVAGDLAPAVMTGGHAASLAAVAEGRADVASVDAATLALLARVRPALAAGVQAVGHGPWVPATPLITGVAPPVSLAALRASLVEAVASPDLAEVRALLGIDAFVGIDTDAYGAPVRDVVAVAERVLPRLGTHDLRA